MDRGSGIEDEHVRGRRARRNQSGRRNADVLETVIGEKARMELKKIALRERIIDFLPVCPAAAPGADLDAGRGKVEGPARGSVDAASIDRDGASQIKAASDRVLV